MSVTVGGPSLDQRQAIYDWVRQVADEMFLKDWSITVSNEAVQWAEVKFRGPYKQATLSVASALLLEADHEVRSSLVHEIMHLSHGDYRETLEPLLAELSDATKAAVLAQIERHTEQTIEHAARVIVEHVDLPPLDGIRKATEARNSDDQIDNRGGAET